MNHNMFIGRYKLSDNICGSLINYFKDNKDLHRKSQHKYKKSTEVDLDLKTDISKNYFKELQECVNEYQENYDLKLGKFAVTDRYGDKPIIQHYMPGEGFYEWHCERGGYPASHRVLVYMTYLNDVENGGTEFKFQKIKIDAKKGLTLIWPSDFTHTHRGIISNEEEKYIITGWFSFIQ